MCTRVHTYLITHTRTHTYIYLDIYIYIYIHIQQIYLEPLGEVVDSRFGIGIAEDVGTWPRSRLEESGGLAKGLPTQASMSVL